MSQIGNISHTSQEYNLMLWDRNEMVHYKHLYYFVIFVHGGLQESQVHLHTYVYLQRGHATT